MNSLLLLLCIIAAVTMTTATDYCSTFICDHGDKHIACGHREHFSGICPSDAKMVTITDDLKKVLVDAHNEKRNFIAGGGDARHKPACRMATMEWDDELAFLASLNVMQCQMSHDRCHNTDAFTYSGQNLGLINFFDFVNHKSKLEDIVEMWYHEVEYSKQEYIDSYPSNYLGPDIEHFSVMMADRNIRLGCAAATYSPRPFRYTTYLVACNYATTNMMGFPIYESCSEAASSCTTGTNPKYPHLCSEFEKYDVNKWY